VIAYDNAVKQHVLGVPEELLGVHGAVSSQVAESMASGVRARLGADVALSITGIAGPDGGTESKPVGLVYLGLAVSSGVQHRELFLHGDRDRIRRHAAFAGLALVRHALRRTAEG
jgi:nicotinamide-nucleotide amidase